MSANDGITQPQHPASRRRPSADADVMIVGGGLVGGTLGLLLAKAGLRTMLIDRIDPAAGLDAASCTLYVT